MRQLTDKVVGFVVHDGEVLVFEHPTTGTQFPAGTVGPGEAAIEAARRECAEEVGVALSGGRILGVSWGEVTRRFYGWELASRPDVPDVCETDGHRFRPYWLPFEDVERVVHPAQRPWWRFAPRDEAAPPRFRRLAQGDIAVRALADADADYEALGRWMSDDRVLAWYGGESHRLDAAGARRYYAPALRGEDDVHPTLIERDGEPVGYLQYYPILSYAEYQLEKTDPPGAWALDLFLAADHWGEGIGPTAIELVLRYLDEELGVNDVFIDPWVRNERAIHTYEKCGFTKVRILPEHELHDDELTDNWLMHRALLAPASLDRSVAALVEAAFDGVPPPDAEHRTLYQAEAWDDYERCDRSRDHLGRWQDIPDSHFAECAWALAHLDEQGIRYYLPALMLLYLRRAATAVNAPGISLALDSLQQTLQPAWPSRELADYQRRRFSLLTFDQRRAILRFVEHAASTELLRELWFEVDGIRDAWLRAVRAGDDPQWSRSFRRTTS